MADRTHGPDRHAGDDTAGDHALAAWIVEPATALEVDPAAVDREMLLGVSRSAHGVTRAAAPFTMFLMSSHHHTQSSTHDRRRPPTHLLRLMR